MEKRGQVYILAAIMLGVVIYSLSTIVNIVQQEEIKGDFEALSSNFETESSKFINSVLQSGGNIPDSFVNFTFLFTSYSKSKSPGFHIFYALAYGDNLSIGNFMDEEIAVYIPCPVGENPGSDIRVLGCLSNISAQISFDGLTVQTGLDFTELTSKCVATTLIGGNREYCVDIEGVMYNLSIDPNVPRIFSLSRLESGEQILNSVQGEVGEEQICSGKVVELQCKESHEFCCWSEGVCLEGSCPEDPEEPEISGDCGDGKCKRRKGENCNTCEADCPCNINAVCQEGRCRKN